MFDWLHFISYAAAATITPGPNNIISMSSAGQQGFRKSYPFNLGQWLGLSIVMVTGALFCNTLSAVIPKIKTPMLFVGAAYMLWLAWKTFRRSSVIEEDSRQVNFLSGVCLQFINPKTFVYCVVSMEAYILPHYQGNYPALVGFGLLLAAIGAFNTLLWGLFGSAFKTLFTRYARITNTVMALLLVYCAVALFL